MSARTSEQTTPMDTDDDVGALPWKFSQCFGEKTVVEEMTEADVLSAVEFGPTGEYLATGDKGGRVVVFKQSARSPELAKAQGKVAYSFYTEFQSHEPEFDYLKSLEIEEKINCIRWCKNRGNGQFLLSTNDKTIKLWKIYEKDVIERANFNLLSDDGSSNNSTAIGHAAKASKKIYTLKVPTVQSKRKAVTAVPRRIFSNAHAYHINSVSVNSDGESYLSADDLRINMWNMERTDQSFNIVDIKPDNMEELTEVITASSFHPQQCNLFMYSSSRGCIKLGDMRQRALCDEHSKMFEITEDTADRSFFSEIIASISDVKFAGDNGRYIVSRDYLTLKIWDIHMESRPIKTISIHEHLRAKLCDLYENDCIFDKFETSISGDGKYFMTGSYNSAFHIYDSGGLSDTRIESSRAPPPMNQCMMGNVPAIDVNQVDFNKKTLHLSWHPQENAVAIAGLNNLFIYSV